MGRTPRAARRGVTLLEMMVVLAIIGITMTILLPNFFGATDRVRDSQLDAALIRGGQAQERYASRYERYWTSGQPQDLFAFGLELDAGITLHVVSASASSYCMEAFAAAESARRFSLAAGEGIVQEPCAER
jgi:prepilin-type N-terminal cleavage/methylation domain-containing protein